MSDRPRRLSIGTQALVGLMAGLAAGAGMVAGGETLRSIGLTIEIVGTLWIHAILMTIIPLVVSKIIVSIAGTENARSAGPAGIRAAVTFLALLTTTAALTAAVMPAVFGSLEIDSGTSATLRHGAGATNPASSPGLAQAIVALVPTNAVRAAADGAIVPLLVFTIAFAFGASRVRADLRGPLVAVFRGVDAAIGVLLHWIVAASPYGVFALGIGLAIRVGAGIVTALAFYVVVSATTLVLLTAALYAVVYLGTGMSPRRFGRAAAPAQVVAFGTHSSAASLPAMIEGAETHLRASPVSTGFVLPLSLALFKYSSPAWFIVVTHLVGRLYGVAIDPSRSVAIVIAAVLTSFAVGGVPSGAAVAVAPVLLAAGLPVEAMGLLLAVDPIPNAFRTVANVTGMMAVTALADGRVRSDPPR